MLLARKAAWGPKLVKNEAPRKVRVNIAGNPYTDGEEQEHVQGRMIEMLVQGDEIYLVSTRLLRNLRLLRTSYGIGCLAAS
jgi:hypothetical protein